MVANTAATRVVGTLKRKIIIHVSTALGLGVVSSMAWWHLYHAKWIKSRDQWYIDYAKSKAEE